MIRAYRTWRCCDAELSCLATGRRGQTALYLSRDAESSLTAYEHLKFFSKHIYEAVLRVLTASTYL